MIAYFDTSALVPLLVAERGTERCQRIWVDSEAVVTSRLTYVEAAAAFSQAVRLGRVRQEDHTVGLGLLEQLWQEVDVIEVSDRLARRAAQLAHDLGLRGYDAVHCASAEEIMDAEVVAAAGDRRLLGAWDSLGIATADTSGGPGD